MGKTLAVQYIITIPLAIYALVLMPRKGTLSQYWENARRNSAIFGLIPCGPLAIMFSVIGVGAYYLRIKAIMGKESKLASNWNLSPNPSASNPFGGSGLQAPPIGSGNPFTSGGSSTQPLSGNANPFATDGYAGPSDETGQRNPFA